MVDEGDPLGKVVTQQAVGVLVAAALPGRSGVAEVHGRAQLLGGGQVASHLGALIPCDRSHQRRRQILHAGHQGGV